MEQMLFFYVPLTVAFLYNVIVYVFLARVVVRVARHSA